ncbi:MAG: hypothetical protein IJI58_04745 [Bacilli bacterium]|nr:hypothetical protein [Bacilli bacterium]
MLEKLIEINNNIINQTTNEKEKEKHLLIKKILEDKNCFLKMDIETSYALLRELNIPDKNIKNTYLNLIDPSNTI